MKINPLYVIFALFAFIVIYMQVRISNLGELIEPNTTGWLNESYPIDLQIAQGATTILGALLMVILVFKLIRFTIKMLLNAVK